MDVICLFTKKDLQAYDPVEQRYVGVAVSKADKHRAALRGYIAMLAVEKEYRGIGIGNPDIVGLLCRY